MIDIRLSRALAATAVVALPLLAACGGATSSAPAASPALASSAAAAPSTSAPAASATPEPSDATDDVKGASEKFMQQVFTLKYSDSADDYHARIKPLVTPKLYSTLTKEIDVEKSLKTARARFGTDGRAATEVIGDVKVSKLSLTEATTKLKFVTKIQKRDGAKWKTVKESVDDTATLSLVKEGDAWLVDDLK